MTIDASDIYGTPPAQDACGPASRSEAGAITGVSAGARQDGVDRKGMDRHGMGKEARRRIGRNLRILYADVLDMPLPDRFEALLADLSGKPAPRETS